MNFSSVPCVLHARPSHPPWFDRTINIWCSVQVMKLLIMQSSPVSRYLLPLKSRYRVTFRNNLVLCGKKLSAPRPTPKLQDHPWSAVRDVIHSYLPCLEVVSSIRNSRTRHVVMTRTHMTDNSTWCNETTQQILCYCVAAARPKYHDFGARLLNCKDPVNRLLQFIQDEGFDGIIAKRCATEGRRS
jgi:hypothetical protein